VGRCGPANDRPFAPSGRCRGTGSCAMILKRLSLEQYEALNPRCEIEHDGTRIVFATPTLSTKWRVETIYAKEPWTLEWIAGFDARDILLDVGRERRHVHDLGGGQARKHGHCLRARGAKLCPAEPQHLHHRLGDRITAYCLGLSDRHGFTALHTANYQAGSSGHAVGRSVAFQASGLRSVLPARLHRLSLGRTWYWQKRAHARPTIRSTGSSRWR
jgi:hypothetical protein